MALGKEGLVTGRTGVGAERRKRVKDRRQGLRDRQ